MPDASKRVDTEIIGASVDDSRTSEWRAMSARDLPGSGTYVSESVDTKILDASVDDARAIEWRRMSARNRAKTVMSGSGTQGPVSLRGRAKTAMTDSGGLGSRSGAPPITSTSGAACSSSPARGHAQTDSGGFGSRTGAPQMNGTSVDDLRVHQSHLRSKQESAEVEISDSGAYLVCT